MRKTRPQTDGNPNEWHVPAIVRRVSGWSRNGAAIVAAAMLAFAPAGAQDVGSFDPNEAFDTASETVDSAQNAAQEQAGGAIDADLVDPALRTAPPLPDPNVDTPSVDSGSSADPTVIAGQAGFDDEFSQYADPGSQVGQTAVDDAASLEEVASVNPDTYGEDDLIGAAEGVFGKGAQGLAGMIENLLREQGEPNGYIVGREAGGAFIFGARYGSGTLHHKIEGQRKVYWTGPSLGIDAGANAGNTFVLVYNLYDSEDIFRRYPAGEGQAYFVGGLHASYMRRGDVVLIPIRVGAGLRLGVNAGYMRFSKKHRWLPF
ncbi:MAG: DUF1134 domain-containing protein [Erythrobacter sp.]